MNKVNCCNLFLLLISTSHLLAQHTDCHTALEICDNNPLHIIAAGGIGSTDSDIGNSCIMQEYNPMWVKWTVLEGGIITFVITPDSIEQDIDFIIFRTGNNYDCSNKTQLRCMAAGANTSQPPHMWVNCTGATGLSVDEVDVEEPAGCLATSNNYLAPIQATAGDQYVMLINNFVNSAYGYTLNFTGTAVLDCITVFTDSEPSASQEGFTIYPTVSTGIIYLNIPVTKLPDSRLNFYSMEGQLVYSNYQVAGSASTIDLHQLTTGPYLVTLQTEYGTQTQRFFLLK